MKDVNENSEVTSGYHESFWTDSVPQLPFGSLNTDEETDVVIVGAGIAGLSVGYALTKVGKRVIILDDGLIGSGESGRTTAHISTALDDRYLEIEKSLGEENAALAASSHSAAIHFVSQIVADEKIDCDFEKLNGYLFLDPSDRIQTLRKEFESTQKAGLKTEILPAVPGISNHEGPCLRFPDQAQFHPMKYLLGLSKTIVENGGRIFQFSHVTEISKDGVQVNGLKVRAKHIVVATNSPINNRVTMHTKQFPYRTYVVAAEIPKESLPRALWWDTGDQNSQWVAKPYHYVRTQSFNDTADLLIVGGEDHKTGQADAEHISEEDRYALLERWARDHFPMITNIAYTWSGQVLEPIDMMGFIGRNPGDDNIYIVTGDSGNGMTHGTIAGMLIRDLITGVPNPWEKLYDPARVTFSAAGDFVKEVSNMAKQYLDYFTPGEMESVEQLRAGEGTVIRSKIQKLAVYRDPSGQVQAYSAVCPHLGCYVHWNADEKSFDCPCHGSRFSCEGKVMNGPAISDLKPIDIMVSGNKVADL
ncbi:MAG TPA: FAD-dependent oxidoreductase [Ohtaekwangia sp.]|nr:FAD-dependent oxidoreductase [Ohtaekwangia sp.]